LTGDILDTPKEILVVASCVQLDDGNNFGEMNSFQFQKNAVPTNHRIFRLKCIAMFCVTIDTKRNAREMIETSLREVFQVYFRCATS
jgi:hypothetical protein